MEEKNKKELSERRESRVLYEPPMPLFPDGFPSRKRRIYIRVAALVVFIAAAVGFWMVAASGKGGGGDAGESECDTSETDSEYIFKTEAEGETSYIETEETGETATATCELQTEITEEYSESAERTEEKSEMSEEIETVKVTEADLSQIEKGEGYVISYTEKPADISGLIDRGFSGGEVSGGAPLVMILHTHTSERYLGNGASATAFEGVVSVGDELVRRLNSLGVSAIHCTVIHDNNDSNAYSNARDTIETMLRIYPSIKYVIDLHRLEIESDGAWVKTFSGGDDNSAQVRLTVSAEAKSAWQEELCLALALRKSMNAGGERICMPAVLSASRYNADLSAYYLMVDIGSSGNTVKEARAAAVRLAEALADVLLT